MLEWFKSQSTSIATLVLSIFGSVGFPMILPNTPYIGWMILIIGIFFASILYWRGYIYWKQQRSVISIDGRSSSIELDPNIQKIVSPKTPTRLPKAYNLIYLSLAVVVFGLSVYQLTNWIVNRASFNVFGLILFIGAFFVAPIFVWIEVLVIERKQVESGESYVVAKSSFQVVGDSATDIFAKCYQVLMMMNAQPPEQMRKWTHRSDSEPNAGYFLSHSGV